MELNNKLITLWDHTRSKDLPIPKNLIGEILNMGKNPNRLF